MWSALITRDPSIEPFGLLSFWYRNRARAIIVVFYVWFMSNPSVLVKRFARNPHISLGFHMPHVDLPQLDDLT